MEYWIGFFVATFLISITPGPDILLLLSKHGKNSKTASFYSAFGLWLAAFTHIMAVSAGLTAIIYSSHYIFLAIKLIGAAYLIYLAVKLFFTKNNLLQEHDDAYSDFFRNFTQGFMISISNPKSAIFFMAFLPTFIREENHLTPGYQILLLGAIAILVKILVESTLILFSAWIHLKLSEKNNFSHYINKLTSMCFLFFGFQVLMLNVKN